MEKQKAHRLSVFARTTAFILLISGILFLLVEGTSSALFVFKLIRFRYPFAERLHTRYDPELGWVSRPNVYIRDMYGPAVYLQTNSQGFRNAQDFARRIPAGKLRIICSGDSFTLGYGVDNAHTWCNLLAERNPQLESVNMGQGGYGLDQAYLWYLRAGEGLEQNLQIMAVIYDDFLRMESSDFMGYGKPTLALKNGAIVVEHVPVRAARMPGFKPWLLRNLGAVDQLRSVWLLDVLARNLAPGWRGMLADPSPTPSQKALVGKILDTLESSNARKHSAFVLVYLPMEQDVYQVEHGAEWRTFFRERARNGLHFIDLTDDFRDLPLKRLNGMFIHDAAQGLVAGHYTAEGNKYVAQTLAERLQGMGLLAGEIVNPAERGK